MGAHWFMGQPEIDILFFNYVRAESKDIKWYTHMCILCQLMVD